MCVGGESKKESGSGVNVRIESGWWCECKERECGWWCECNGRENESALKVGERRG